MEDLPKENEDGILKYEGTSLYLAPELVTESSYISCASDSWALGCTCYYLVTARLPIWVDHDVNMKSEFVKFFMDAHKIFAERSVTDEDVKKFILDLLKEDPQDRAIVQVIATDRKHWINSTQHGLCLNFFQKEKGPLRGGDAFQEIEGDDPWAKRQMSKIWTVMDTNLENYTVAPRSSKASFDEPLVPKIPEELTGSF